MDIVYVFKKSPENDSAELRYSLRTLKNINHGRIFLVGDKPDWVVNVEHISVPQDDTKARNVARNLSTAAETEIISEDFIIMNDDFFFMKQFASMPTLHWGTMRQVIAKYEARYPEDSNYMTSMKLLLELLNSLGFAEPLSYELHVPMVLNKTKLRTMHEAVEGRLYQYRSFYGNYFNVGGTYTDDVKVFIDPQHNDPSLAVDPLAYFQKQSLLSATGGSFERGPVGEYIRGQFTEKSPYEI